MRALVEKLGTGAVGIARNEEGKTVFLPSTLPGEEVEYRVLDEKKNYLTGEAEWVMNPSSLRIVPSCPFSGKCGGCDFDIVDEKASASLKAEIVNDNLRRIGFKKDGYVSEEPYFTDPFGYRHRVRFHVNLHSGEIGFLSRRGSSLVPIDFCPRLTKLLNELLKSRSEIIKAAKRNALERGLNRYGYAEVPMIEGEDGVSFGKEPVTIRVAQLSYRADANVFFQSNVLSLPAMLQYVKANTTGDTIMDLYSGVGTFSALFPEKRVFAVEKFAPCLSYARLNAPSAVSVTDDVAIWAKRKRGEKIDTVIVDPPRVGLDKSVPDLISSFNPERIIYVSCDSVTLSRDVARFADYDLKSVKVFDLYPGSSHEESVVVMSRIG